MSFNCGNTPFAFENIEEIEAAAFQVPLQDLMLVFFMIWYTTSNVSPPNSHLCPENTTAFMGQLNKQIHLVYGIPFRIQQGQIPYTLDSYANEEIDIFLVP